MLKSILSVAVVVGKIYIMAMVMTMAIIPHRRMNDLLHLYL